MADPSGNAEQKLGLSPEERRLFTQVFSAADSEGIGVVTGDVALKFFPEKTRLPSEVLGEIWQIADTDDKGFVTPAGFYVILRLIGYAQSGRSVSAELALKPGGPLPRFEGVNITQPTPAPLQAQGSGGPIRVPPLPPDKAHQYAALFDESGAIDGALPGNIARQIFDRAQLSNDVLARIWNLADTEQRGKLSCTEFIIAMHLLASYRTGALRMLPNNLPAGLYEAAARRGAPPSRPVSGSRQGSDVHPASAVPRQFSGAAGTPRTSSPLARQPYPSPGQPSGGMDGWAINPQEKAQFDSQFARLDTSNQGFVSGEQAVEYFSRSRLPEDDLATIWDLSDITSTGQLNRDEFAVAMYLIRQQLSKRGPLPTTLPSNLIPPSMRRQAPSTPNRQPTAPVAPSKPKSAAEDLFGLDAITPPAPQAPQSTGGSSAFTPTGSEQAGSQPQSNQSSTMFKPFVPTSSFGQSIITPQATGAVGDARQPQSTPSTNRASDDLLGDADPEVSKRLTNETSELANLSNQVGNLSDQMKEVQAKRGSTGQNLSQVNSQKKEFEARLAQFRSAYEQEAREVKTLEERLAQARSETQKAQQDFAMVQHSYQGLQDQRQQTQAALEADQKENASLKERMRTVNNETTQLKAQLEKMRSEARQQKGLVAINKKQLSTNETERERTRSELERTTSEYNNATRELEESKRALESSPVVASRAPAASPAPSAASMNPFFRRTSTAPPERGFSQSSAAASPQVASPNYNAFDSIFGTPSSGAVASHPPPPTTFHGDDPAESGSTAQSVTGATESSSPSGRPSTSQSDLPSEPNPPPPPSQSRQITSNLLPLNEQISRAASPSSSIGVAAPASRFGDTSDAGTEPDQEHPAFKQEHSPLRATANAVTPGSTVPDSEEVPTPQAGSFEFPPREPAQHANAPLSAAQIVPGAFPGDQTPLATPNVASQERASVNAPREVDPFATGSQEKAQASPKDDFASAFEPSANDKPPQESPLSAHEPKPPTRDEFPPIQEFGGDDESDSDSEKGFDDNFTAASPPRPRDHPESTTASEQPPHAAQEERPTFARALTSDTNFSNAATQKSTISRQDTVDSANGGAEKGDSNQLAADYAGLLPTREVPSSLNGTAHTATNGSAGDALFGDADPKGKAPAQPPVASRAGSVPKSGIDDFDDEFADLSEAQAADDKGDDAADFGGGQGKEGFDEFNPTFDSPAPSKATTYAESTHHPFHDFESSLSQGGASQSGKQPAQHTSDDWDAMFAGLDAPGASGAAGAQANGGGSAASGRGDAFDAAFAPPPAQSSLQPGKPPLGRAISQGTEHDDPILKRLTSMGYPREQSLQALEKFDYNLDKAADYLTSKG